jgi:predicted MPP superfamily phosphohydrolase
VPGSPYPQPEIGKIIDRAVAEGDADRALRWAQELKQAPYVTWGGGYLRLFQKNQARSHIVGSFSDQESQMRILHISDLHAAAKDKADRSLLVEAMLTDAERIAATGAFDIAVVTGDLANFGKSDEFDLARELILAPLSERLGVPPDRTFVVPGNHDVDRDAILRMVELGLESGLRSREDVARLADRSDELEQALIRLDSWRSFVDSEDFVAVGGSDHRLVRTEFLEVDGKTYGIVMLNSAWRCYSERDKGKLSVGGPVAEEALREIGASDARLVLIHHPLDWLQGFEADEIGVELETQGAVVFSGHEHESKPTAVKSPRGEAIYLRAGCLYTHLKYPNSFYVVDIDPGDRKVDVKIRRWSSETRHFDAATEIADGGETAFGLPAAGGYIDLGHPPFSTVMRMIAEAAAELRVLPEDLAERGSEPNAIEEVLIAPRFLSHPVQEARALATMTDGVEKLEIDAVDELLEANVLIVGGEAQHGVSSSLFWILSRAYRADASKMPAYLSLPESRIGAAKESATLAKAASRFGHRGEDNRDPDLMLAVDDMDPDAGRRFERLIDFISKNPRHRFLLGCSSDHVPGVKAALEAAGVEFSEAHLAPFGKAQLRKLASTVSRGPGESDLDQIYGLIRTQSLPQTPFTMLALIAVMSTGFVEADDLNESSLLEAFVNLLLGSGEFADMEQLGMNFRKRVVLLSVLAREIDERDGQVMSEQEVERFFFAFFDARALRISAGLVLQSLVRRNILVIDEKMVGFRHPALLQLFLGKWMLESDENKAVMLDDPVRNAAAITHAAALKRSDRELLEKVGEFAARAIGAVAERLPRAKVDRVLETFEAVDTWADEHLEKSLEIMPARKSTAETDREFDRFNDLFDVRDEFAERPAFSSAKEMEAATMLLSDVLRSSDLVDDRDLKVCLFELATEGWILLIGLTAEEDVEEGSVREFLETILERMVEDEELRELLSPFVLLMVTVITAFVAVGKLGAKSLAATIEACLENEEFARSTVATCFAVWMESNLDLPEWPQRLEELLGRLKQGTYLRNATISLAVAHYRSGSEKTASKLEEILPRHLAAQNMGSSTSSAQTKAQIAKIREQLKKSRRDWQHGHGTPDPWDPDLLAGPDA